MTTAKTSAKKSKSAPARRAADPALAAAEAERQLTRLVGQFGGQRILVVGDVILDRYLWGEVDRTSPEAPVPVVRMREQTGNLGGAANVAANLVALGARPTLVGVTGRDAAGQELDGLLKGLKLSTAGLVRHSRRPTTVKTRVVSMGQQLLRLDHEDASAQDEATATKLLEKFGRALERCELVILSDYGKGVLHETLCRAMITRAREAGRPVVIDPKGTQYQKYHGATVVKPNLKEAQAATGITIDSPETLQAAGEKLRAQMSAHAVVISRGALGVSIFERSRPPVHIPAQARSVYDVNGAGDSLISVMALALACGARMEQAAALGNLAGSIVVGKFGAATVEPGELLQSLSPAHGAHKLRTRAQMAAEIKALRAGGRRVVLTNGCFDLLHLGHLKFLARARRLGDALVVAINSDASVRAVKGPPRPVLGQEERAALLGALDAVDYVVIFDEPTPEALLEQLRPDVLVKGNSLAPGEVVGRELVEGWGGRVVSLPRIGEMTTDQVVSRLAAHRGGQKK